MFNKNLLAISISVTMLASPVWASSDFDSTSTRYETLQQKLVSQNKKLEIRLFNGSGMNYGNGHLPINAKLQGEDSRLTLTFDHVYYRNVDSIKNLLIAPSDGSNKITESEFNAFLYHTIAPTISLVPYSFEANNARTEKSSKIPEIRCYLDGIKDAATQELLAFNSDYSNDKRLSFTYACPIDTNYVDNDTFYNISWNVPSDAMYKFYKPAEKTQYRLALTRGDSNFARSDVNNLTPRLFMNMALKDVAVGGDYTIMPHALGPNGIFKFNIHLSSEAEIKQTKTTIEKMKTSLEALGYHPQVEFVDNWADSNVIIYKTPLPNAEHQNSMIRGGAQWVKLSNRNAMIFNSDFDLSTNFGSFVMLHELSHIIGLAHQASDVESLMGQHNYLPVILAPSENSQPNTVFSYADAQVLAHIAQQMP